MPADGNFLVRMIGKRLSQAHRRHRRGSGQGVGQSIPQGSPTRRLPIADAPYQPQNARGRRVPDFHRQSRRAVSRDRAEFADSQAVAYKWKMIQNVILEIPNTVRIVVIGEIADLDIWPGDDILQEANLRETGHWIGRVWAGTWHTFSSRLTVHNLPQTPARLSAVAKKIPPTISRRNHSAQTMTSSPIAIATDSPSVVIEGMAADGRPARPVKAGLPPPAGGTRFCARPRYHTIAHDFSRYARDNPRYPSEIARFQSESVRFRSEIVRYWLRAVSRRRYGHRLCRHDLAPGAFLDA